MKTSPMSEKKCYTVWYHRHPGRMSHGGKVVWLTNNQLLVHLIEGLYYFDEVIDPEALEKYKMYRNQKVYHDK